MAGSFWDDYWFPGNMAWNYNERKVDRFKNEKFVIDTAAVTDRWWAYESAIAHKDFNDGEWIVLKGYRTKDEAKAGHDELVKFYLENEVDEITDIFDRVTYDRNGVKDE